jgi:hypothetical protein
VFDSTFYGLGKTNYIKNIEKCRKFKQFPAFFGRGDGKTWEVLEQDDNGTFISADIHLYSFTATGQYKVVVTDLYRTGFDAVEKEFSFTEKVEEVTERETKDTPAPMNTDEKQGGINGFVIALIIFGAVVIIGGVMVIIFNRKRGI